MSDAEAAVLYIRVGRVSLDVILGIDWLAQHYASLDCREKVVIFRIPNDEEFRFRGDKSSMP